MDLMKILRSFEEFIFEAISWLVFYPVTLWRVVRGPLAAMDYSDREQTDGEEGRYDDTLSPPLFLLATILLANLITALLHVPPPPQASPLTHAIFGSQQNLLLFRSLCFSLLPLVAAVTLLRHQKRRLSRETLRPPFYAQCYLAGVCAAVMCIGLTIFSRPDVPNGLGAAVMAAGGVWFLTAQSRWFARRLNLPLYKGFGIAVGATLRATVYLFAIIVPIVAL
ncbi:MAG: hypothetical protein ACK4MI_09885 [Brevundimonas sp.]|uniref:hypothetical protein n=1 Tax=Brevundimonas sp. TaxID=1871086 RepID=UPI0028D55184|nr:hypothetical protein [uncultured Brevundimonas sp.]